MVVFEIDTYYAGLDRNEGAFIRIEFDNDSCSINLREAKELLEKLPEQIKKAEASFQEHLKKAIPDAQKEIERLEQQLKEKKEALKAFLPKPGTKKRHR